MVILIYLLCSTSIFAFDVFKDPVHRSFKKRSAYTRFDQKFKRSDHPRLNMDRAYTVHPGSRALSESYVSRRFPRKVGTHFTPAPNRPSFNYHVLQESLFHDPYHRLKRKADFAFEGRHDPYTKRKLNLRKQSYPWPKFKREYYPKIHKRGKKRTPFYF